jgi:sugar-specific transcriptional regulator TrmB
LLLNEEGIQLLTKIGLTKTQAKIYLTLLKNGNVKAKALAEKANSPRPLVYAPHRFAATPPDSGLQILLYHKFQNYRKIQEETKLFLREIKKNQLELPLEQDYKFKMVESKERILQIIKSQHKNAQQSIHIITTLQRFHSALDCCFEQCEKALQRTVEYRIVIGKHEGNAVMTENLRVLLTYPNFWLKLSCKPLSNNMAIFDSNEATFNFFPSKFFNESPIIWTNHTSLILMAQDHFDKVWKSARNYAPKGN